MKEEFLEISIQDVEIRDLYEAMKEIPGYIDITPNDLKEIYKLAIKHALKRLMESIKAKDIMVKDVISISPDAPLSEAIDKMSLHGVSGLPVTDDERVIGVISEKDILSAFGLQEKNLFEIFSFCLKGKIESLNLETYQVREFMSSPAITVKKDTSLSQIVKLMREKNINRLPVVDREGILKGIISRNDILRVIAKKL